MERRSTSRLLGWRTDARASLMCRASMGLTICAAILSPIPAAAQGPGPVITSPTEGQALRGQVAIAGTAGGPAFADAQLAFAYASDVANSWFIIQTLSQPVENAGIATWDTTSISDGEYILRLRVTSQDGTTQDTTVAVQVRNYTTPLSATSTPSAPQVPTLQIPTPVVILASATAISMVPEAPSPLPPNPAAVTAADVSVGIWRGALFAAGLFLLLGLVLLRSRK